jgi:hypothetical protein
MRQTASQVPVAPPSGGCTQLSVSRGPITAMRRDFRYFARSNDATTLLPGLE